MPESDDNPRTRGDSGEDEAFPEDFRRLMRRVFGPLNDLQDWLRDRTRRR